MSAKKARYCICLLYTSVNVPITGVGGIETWRDALEFILVGASNLQVTTAVMQYGYRIVEDMISGLSHYMEDNGIDKL